MLTTYTAGYLTGALISLAVAALVFWTRPAARQNRLLALILTWEAMTHVAAAMRVQFGFWEMQPEALGALTVFTLAIAVSPLLYLLFLSTIEVPLTRPLRNDAASSVLGLLAVAVPAGLLLATELQDPRAIRPGAWKAAFGSQMLVALYGLAVAIQLYRRSPTGTPRRRQAGAYVAAFGGRDALIVVFAAMIFATGETQFTRTGGATPEILGLRGQWIPLIWGLVFAAFLTYGILSTQLFGIDLKLKLGIEKSTFVGAFGVAFLAVSEIVEALLGVDGTLYGVGAAVAIGLFFRRIEQGAEYVADRLMPGVEDTPAYREQRKQEIYRIQLEELMADEQITAKERRALLRLQESLGLDGDDANRLEREVLGASGGEA